MKSQIILDTERDMRWTNSKKTTYVKTTFHTKRLLPHPSPCQGARDFPREATSEVVRSWSRGKGVGWKSLHTWKSCGPEAEGVVGWESFRVESRTSLSRWAESRFAWKVECPIAEGEMGWNSLRVENHNVSKERFRTVFNIMYSRNKTLFFKLFL